MQNILVSIRDSKAETWSAPMAQLNEAVAMRTLIDSLTPELTLFTHAEDYALYQIGMFDPVSGTVRSTERRHIMDLTTARSAAMARQQRPTFSEPAGSRYNGESQDGDIDAVSDDAPVRASADGGDAPEPVQ